MLVLNVIGVVGGILLLGKAATVFVHAPSLSLVLLSVSTAAGLAMNVRSRRILTDPAVKAYFTR